MLTTIPRKAFPGGKISAPRLKGARLDTRFCETFTGYADLVPIKSDVGGQTSSHWSGAEVRRGRWWMRCRPCYLIMVQNYEAHPKIVIALFQKGALI
ncbi:hypothetical protein AVEN_86114-1 [Araneus ventricosus]|uniref:Uncharacterized protein n=1 Tax=Araneus ventricosus TaxID=182803 RepID=A0A4Y2JHB3_ARAVE|nr:hypothetical protein AVEN_86114-1 [Araneus ventricosus]